MSLVGDSEGAYQTARMRIARRHIFAWHGSRDTFLTHCILNRLSYTIYWKSPILILGTSGYEIYIFLEKND